MSLRPPTILVTGSGGAPSTNFIRSLKASKQPFRIIGTDSDPYYLFRSEADKTLYVPKASERAFIPAINAITKKYQVDLLHIQNDFELGVVSQHREKFVAPLYLPSKKTVTICQNKLSSYILWEKAGLTVPKTMKIGNAEDLQHAFDQLGKKLWIRSAEGAAGKWSLPVSTFAIAKAWIDAHDGWGDFVAAEQLTKDSITWMSLWNKGTLLVAQSRKRLYWEMGKVSPSGVTGVTGGGETVRDSVLDDIAVKAIHAIDSSPHGLYGVDLTFDSKGIPNPTEINIGRFFTTHHFFTEAGLNMPLLYVMTALGKPVVFPKRTINPLPAGLIWIRGMDFLPILTTRKKVDAITASVKKHIPQI